MKLFKLKKMGTIILTLLIALVFIAPSSAFAEKEVAAGDAGLGAGAAIGPLGIAAIAAGTLAAVVVIAESVTDSDSTSSHTTSDHIAD